MKFFCWGFAVAEVPFELSSVRPFVHLQRQISEMGLHVFGGFLYEVKEL